MTKDQFRAGCARISVGLVLGIFPIMTFGSYFGISAVKMTTFMIAVAAGVLPILFYNSLSADIWREYRERGGIRGTLSRMSAVDWGMLLFMVTCLVSTLGSGYPEASWTGFEGRYQGLSMMLAYGGMYWMITRYYEHKDGIWVVFIAAGAAACLLAILQHFGIDALGFYENVSAGQRALFVSTIGNVNFFASYTCMLAPVAMFMYTKAKSWKMRLFYMITGIIIFAGSACSNSDGAILGVGTMAVAMCIWFANRKTSFMRFLEILLAMFLTLIAVVYTTHAAPGAVRLTGVVEELVTDYALPAGAAVVLTARIVIGLFWKKEECRVFRKLILAATIAAVAALGAIMIYVNLVDTKIELGGFTNYLRFSSEWGTLRGREYKAAFAIFENADVWGKLFGCGTDVYGKAFLASMPNAEFYSVSAHCEYLHYVVTLGIAGGAAYLFYAGATVAVGVRNIKKDAVAAALFALGAYLAEAVIGISQVFTTPIFFCLMAMAAAGARRQDGQNLQVTTPRHGR